jgi:hypothetical protein
VSHGGSLQTATTWADLDQAKVADPAAAEARAAEQV